MRLPIISRFRANVDRSERERARRLGLVIREETPRIRASEQLFRELIVDSVIDDAPSLILDDFSEIPIIGTSDISHVVQQRARLRAVDGDWVAQSRRVERGFADYCEYKLGLGRVQWLYPAIEPTESRQIALECWQDRRIKHDLIQAVRHQDLRYVHPHVSTFNVWEMAKLLRHSTRKPITVVGPPPGLASWANDKIEFTKAVKRLLGGQFVPHTECAYNFATLSQKILSLASTHSQLGIKFPFGTGGHGNFRIDAADIRGLSLVQVREQLKAMLDTHCWPQHGRVLIDVWETKVVNSPSVQTWIPPAGQDDPIIEGLFKQSVVGDQGSFVGSCPLDLPDEIKQQIVDSSFLLALLLQSLGYVGRCSFDLILVGEGIENCRLEFIECNARWGGSSIPMTLMNRLKIESPARTYGSQVVGMPRLEEISFADLLRELETDLYDPSTDRGNFILMNPSRIKACSTVDALAIATSRKQVDQLLNHTLPTRLSEIVERHSENARQRFGFPHRRIHDTNVWLENEGNI